MVRCRARFAGLVLCIALPLAAPGPATGVDCYTEIDSAYYETDVRSLIGASTPDAIERIRGELIAYIWKRPRLPEGLPQVDTGVPDPFTDAPDLSNVERIDQLTVPTDDFVSRMYLYVPERPRRRLLIYHVGHSHTLVGSDAATVQFFLDRRYPVLVAFMPTYGPHTGPFNPYFRFHDPMASLETPTLSPIKYFLEPVVQAVNHAKRVAHYSRVYMIGLSGGGWTATVGAAVDPRIRVSVAVAGSLPLYLRTPPCASDGEMGDFEQHHEPLFAIADYLDLYVLAAHGFTRAHLQVLNQYDACCFSGVRFLTYRDVVKDVVRGLDGGRYDLFLDSSHHQHQISPRALAEAIHPFVRRRRL